MDQDTLPDLDYTELQRELDRVKSRVFLNNNAAFYGPLMCSMDFIWDTKVQTAETDGTKLWWNPHWYLSLHFDTRKTVLVHELEHVAKMHMLRMDDRTGERWNIACDININNRLQNEGYTFEGTSPCLDQKFGDMIPEDIYELLPPEPQCAPWGPGSGPDLKKPMTPGQARQVINNVVQATQAARMSKQGGTIPGETELFLKKFLEPVVPWERLLYMYFNDLGGEEYSWARPNRRHQEIYLPTLLQDNDRLEHLAYYLDVSGSISDQDILRFNSEFKYVKDTYNPAKMTMVQFDDGIRAEKIIDEDQPFDEIKVIGRGGTCWGPVKAHIEEHRPTCAVIFTDLGFFDPITPLSFDVPVLWVINHTGANGPYGRTIHIKS
jgi:predicted metal-dependent peptidase